jgi:hypothetical protein
LSFRCAFWKYSKEIKTIAKKTKPLKGAADLDKNLRSQDAYEHGKYDFALFGLGVFKKF